MRSKVYIAKAFDRSLGLTAVFAARPLPNLCGMDVAIKPNFNSTDPFPATTALETLEFVIMKVRAGGAASISIAERSGMAKTRDALDKLGVFELAKRYDARVIVLDEVGPDGWVKVEKGDTHWWRGFSIARVFVDADFVINLPCLKTHRYGGHFTMSLKNNVGAVAKWCRGYNYMWELHISRRRGKMIGEINKFIPNGFVLMDAMKAIVRGGPEAGEVVEPALILLSDDRVAVDAVGVAILRTCGTTPVVSRGAIFDQAQIKRAAELGVGVRSAEEIELVAVNDEAAGIVDKIRRELNK